MTESELKFQLPTAPPPPWREFKKRANRRARAEHYRPSPEEIKLVNAALLLRRPLLVTGPPGVGKSSLAFAVAYQLELGEVLHWPITSKSVRQDGLYQYDALARLQEAALREKGVAVDNAKIEDIGRYITLGPLGSAFLLSTPKKPSVVLIDELDKSDIDLPNDLLHLFEEGEFDIPEITRLPDTGNPSPIKVYAHNRREKLDVPRDGLVRCQAFPLIIITSNGEREFPPAFLRRCLRLKIKQPDDDALRAIVEQHLNLTIAPDKQDDPAQQLLQEFLKRRDKQNKTLATDQLLNAMYLLKSDINLLKNEEESLLKAILAALTEEG